MPTADPRTPLTQTYDVETPEHVLLGLELAGLGSRALAGLADAGLLGVWMAALGFARRPLIGAGVPPGWTTALLLGVGFVSLWGYFTFFEGLRNGQTPGKRWVGIRVVRDTGHPVSLAAAAARNLLRVADFLPPPYLTGAALVLFHPRAKRLGDLVAGTLVVRDRPAEPHAEQRTADEALPTVPLTAEEVALLERFLERESGLDPATADRLAGELAARFAARLPVTAGDPRALLRRLAAHAGRGAAGAPAGDRLAARQRERWQRFRALATRAAGGGLDGFAPEELLEFAARYREVAADLARARTYGARSATVADLERLVAAGHNALYRDQRTSARAAWRMVAREFPAAVVQAWRYVALACLLFLAPGAAGYTLLRERPALGEELLPEVALRRADAGADRSAAGRGYLEADQADRPLIASGIITNNVRVALACFAGGVFFGVGSLVLLAYNGLAFGAILGHFANQGLGVYLLTFVLGHGVLELFAIWVAAAAGFLLGRAAIAPGELTRADALVGAGRLAVRMVGAAVVLLVMAGLIEGFLSASGGGLAPRAAAATASLGFLALYLLNGIRSRDAAT